MATTPNGFTVITPGSSKLGRFEVAGVPFVVWKEALPAFRWLTTFLHAVEPVTEQGWDGGYAHRYVAGTSVWSEHAAGSAIDWNAAQHGRGGARFAGWSETQQRVIRWMLTNTAKGKYFEWGADWKNPDPMHFELTSLAKWKAPGNPWVK